MTLLPIRLSFRHLGHCDALEQDIRERAAVLEQHYAGIVGSRRSRREGPAGQHRSRARQSPLGGASRLAEVKAGNP